MARPTRARLDLDALVHNLNHVRSLAPASNIMAVVKANAYGHDAATIAGTLDGRVDALAVACLEEAVELRETGISTPVLLLEGVFDSDELALAAENALWLTIAGEQQLDWLEQANPPQPLVCWLKVNTGMNRLGVSCDVAPAAYQRLLDSVNCAGAPVLYTHFASADNLQGSQTSTQLERFRALPIDCARSAANSAGVLAWPDSHLDWVRPGYMLYGNSPLSEAHPNTAALRPVMTLESAILSVREVPAGAAIGYGGTFVANRPSSIATVAIGYGDGYPRQAPNGTPVLVNGERASLAGRVSMDMITVDVTDIPSAQPGTTVTLWGDGLPVDEVARYAGTLGYELTTRMPARTPRVISGH